MSWDRSRALEGLADAEVHAPLALLRVAVDHEAGNGVELLPEVDADRTNARVVAEARAGGPAQAARSRFQRLGPRISTVDKHNATQPSSHKESAFAGHLHHGSSANGLTVRTQWADLIPAPAPNTRRPADEIPLEEPDPRSVARR